MHDDGDLFERHFMDDRIPQGNAQSHQLFQLKNFHPKSYYVFVERFLDEFCTIMGSNHIRERLIDFGHYECSAPFTKSKYLEFIYRKALSVSKSGVLNVSFPDSLDVFSFAVTAEDFGTSPLTRVQKQNLLVLYTELKGFQTFLSNISDPLKSLVGFMNVVKEDELKALTHVATSSTESRPAEDLGGC